MDEKPAKGIQGFILWTPRSGGPVFRVYDENDRSKFIDYDICHNDLEVEIVSDCAVFRQSGSRGNTLDYSNAVLGRVSKPQ
jgi:hypothetical protein